MATRVWRLLRAFEGHPRLAAHSRMTLWGNNLEAPRVFFINQPDNSFDAVFPRPSRTTLVKFLEYLSHCNRRPTLNGQAELSNREKEEVLSILAEEFRVPGRGELATPSEDRDRRGVSDRGLDQFLKLR